MEITMEFKRINEDKKILEEFKRINEELKSTDVRVADDGNVSRFHQNTWETNGGRRRSRGGKKKSRVKDLKRKQKEKLFKLEKKMEMLKVKKTERKEKEAAKIEQVELHSYFHLQEMKTTERKKALRKVTNQKFKPIKLDSSRKKLRRGAYLKSMTEMNIRQILETKKKRRRVKWRSKKEHSHVKWRSKKKCGCAHGRSEKKRLCMLWKTKKKRVHRSQQRLKKTTCRR